MNRLLRNRVALRGVTSLNFKGEEQIWVESFDKIHPDLLFRGTGRG